MSTPTAVLDTGLYSAISEAMGVSGMKIRLGGSRGVYWLERLDEGKWKIDTEVFKTPAEVRAFALGFVGGFQRGTGK